MSEETPTPEELVEQHTKAELADAAEEKGVEVKSTDTKADIAEKLVESSPHQETSSQEVAVPDFDPIAEMDARHAAQKAAELEAAKKQNYESALASHNAMLDFNNSERGDVAAQHAYAAGLAKLPSDEAYAVEQDRMAAEAEAEGR